MVSLASSIANLFALAAFITYLAAMAAPWWHTNIQGFQSTNCFFDGSCITGDIIYKNNGNLHWVYTTIIVLLTVGWIPFLVFLHLIWFRRSKHHYSFPGRRTLMILSALLTMAILSAAVIVFAVGITEDSPNVNGRNFYDGLYGDRLITFPDGTVREFSWGANAGWYFALVTVALIPIAAFCATIMHTKHTERRVERVERGPEEGYVGAEPSYSRPVEPTYSRPVEPTYSRPAEPYGSVAY